MKPSPLLFDWPHRHRIHLVLPAAILVAAIAHGCVLVLFGIIHPTPRFDGPNPARVYFLAPGSPFHARIQGLLLSSDPALYAPQFGLPASDIAATATYTPQYQADPPSFAPLPPPPLLNISHSLPAGPIHAPAAPREPTSRSVLPQTRIHLSSSLTTRALEQPGQNLTLPTTPDTANSVSFLVGISEHGSILHITPNHSTGDASTDANLLSALRSLRFAPVDSPGTTWGIIEIRSSPAP